MKPRIALLPALLFTLLSPLAADDLRVVVNSGHLGPVRTFDVNDRYNLLFTAGDDGSVRAWDLDSQKLVDVLQVSHHPVMKLIIHPQKTHMAIIQKNGINSYQLSVWNWAVKRRVYSRDLKELPLHITYSPEGTYLVYSETDWDSLTFLESETGKELDVFQDGFGIVSNFAISPSEKTLLAYSPSGKINYYDIETGRNKYTFTTAADLEKIEFTGNLRFMAAVDDDLFVLIDLTSGSILGALQLPEIKTLSVNFLTGDFLCVYPTGFNQEQISVINFSRGYLTERKIRKIDQETITGAGLYYLNTLYIADDAGEIKLFENVPGGFMKTIQGNDLAPIDNLAFLNGEMAFATREHLFFIDSDFFYGRRYNSLPSYFEVDIFNSDHIFPASIDITDTGNFFLWQRDPGSIRFIDRRSGGLESNGYTVDSELVQLTAMGGRIVTLATDGSCTVLDSTDLSEEYTYTGFGLQTVALAGNRLFLGKSRASGFNAAVLNVNINTGETVPVFTESMLMYKALSNASSNKVYALGIEEETGGRTATTLKSFEYPSFDTERTIARFTGEDLSAGIAFDSDDETVYTSLGFEGVTAYGANETRTFKQTDHIPRNIYIHNNLLYTINLDYSITVWNKASGKRLMDFYVFDDLNWAAVLTTGEYYASYGARRKLVVYDGIEQASYQETLDLQLN